MEYGSLDGGKSVLAPSGDAAFALKKANFYYVGKFLLFAIISFIFYNTGSTWIGKIISTVYKGKEAIGATLVARTTSSLAIWFVVHSLVTVCNKNLVDSFQFMFHISWLWLHSLIYIALWVGFWFIPDGFFDFYMQAAMYISFIYLVFQIYFLIIFFHGLNDKFVTEDNEKCMLAITVFIELVSITIFGLCYYFYAPGGCDGNIAIITVNLIITIALFILAFIRENGSIFTASLVNCYVAYLTASGIMCSPGGSCSRVSASTSNIIFTIAASIFTLLWMAYSAFSSSYQVGDCDCGCGCCGGEGEEKPEFSLSFFHALFALASVYLTMVVTNWGNTKESVAWATNHGVISKWVNLGASWASALLYLWTLIAPCLCPDRDFS